MLRWLEANGYPPDSLEGQARYMAHEAMRKYPPTRRILIGANPSDREANTNAITRDFERPRIVNRRSPLVGQAAGVPAAEGSPGVVSGGHSRLRDDGVVSPHSVRRPGDEMMLRQRELGESGQPERQRDGTLHIIFDNAPAGMKTKQDMGGLFRDVRIDRGKSMPMA